MPRWPLLLRVECTPSTTSGMFIAPGGHSAVHIEKRDQVPPAWAKPCHQLGCQSRWYPSLALSLSLPWRENLASLHLVREIAFLTPASWRKCLCLLRGPWEPLLRKQRVGKGQQPQMTVHSPLPVPSRPPGTGMCCSGLFLSVLTFQPMPQQTQESDCPLWKAKMLMSVPSRSTVSSPP